MSIRCLSGAFCCAVTLAACLGLGTAQAATPDEFLRQGQKQAATVTLGP